MSETNDSMPPIRGGKSFVMISVEAISSTTHGRQIPAPICNELLGRDIQHRAGRPIEGATSIELSVQLVQLPGRILLGDVAAGQPRLGVGQTDAILGRVKPVVFWESPRQPTGPQLGYQRGRRPTGVVISGVRDLIRQSLHLPPQRR